MNNEEELDDLIKREIDAREWFIYAVSDNSHESEWVQKECDWRKREESKNKQEWKVDLESDVSIDEISNALIKDLRVHVIYSNENIEFVNKLIYKLKQRDFQITTGSINIEQELRMIDEASEYGTNIVILSQSSMKSKY